MSTRKFTIDGEEVEVLQKLDNGCFAVLPIRVDDAGDEWTANEIDAIIVRQIFDTAPAQKYEEKIVKLEGRIQWLQEELRGLEKQAEEMTRTEKQRKDRYRKFSQLARLDDFIDGKVTHYAILRSWSTPKICAFNDKEAMSEYGREELKLLTLFGNTKGDLAWKLNDYSDGSGSNTRVMPATSYEEALSFVRQYIFDLSISTKENAHEWVVNAAKAFDVSIDLEYIKVANASVAAGLLKEIECAEKTIAGKKDALEKVLAASKGQ